MRHGSLFSGIGGFDLAAEWMGWENIFHCEWMPFPRQVLHYHFPNSISYEDITKTDFTIHRGSIDILTGGFPCQPYSSAGKRLGKEDERHLWPHMLRAIQEIEPTYVVGENVRGLTNWNGGVVFEEVCIDLENSGYEVQPILLPACSVGAPHRRDRVWFIATNTTCIGRNKNEWGRNGESNEFNKIGEARTTPNTDNIRLNECKCDNEKFASQRGINALNDIDENATKKDVTNSVCKRLQRGLSARKYDGKQWNGSKGTIKQLVHSFESRIQFQNFPTQSPICGRDDGLPFQLDGITFSK
jgi:DNA (cytosine-5)-methyltransferase 1